MTQSGWPISILYLGGLLTILFVIGIVVAAFVEMRKTRVRTNQEGQMRQLVQRYEELAASTLDAQQRIAADVAELRARTAAVEQILRTVE